MKKIFITLVFTLGLCLIGCGSDNGKGSDTNAGENNTPGTNTGGTTTHPGTNTDGTPPPGTSTGGNNANGKQAPDTTMTVTCTKTEKMDVSVRNIGKKETVENTKTATVTFYNAAPPGTTLSAISIEGQPLCLFNSDPLSGAGSLFCFSCSLKSQNFQECKEKFQTWKNERQSEGFNCS